MTTDGKAITPVRDGDEEITRTDRVVSAIGWRTPELMGITASLLAGWLLTGWAGLLALALVVKLAADPIRDRRRVRQLTAAQPTATEDAATADGETGRRDGDATGETGVRSA